MSFSAMSNVELQKKIFDSNTVTSTILISGMMNSVNIANGSHKEFYTLVLFILLIIYSLTYSDTSVKLVYHKAIT